MITIGGYNSGGRNRAHSTTGQHKRLDSFSFGKHIPLMERKKIPHVESTVSWTDGANIGIDLYPDKLIVGYAAGSGADREEIRDIFNFSGVQNNYGGGDRFYFECPQCGRRCRYLYLSRRHFKCRTCARLNYRSQQTSKGWEMAVYRLEKFLKDNFKVTGLTPSDAELVTPPRPKGMHEQTYLELLIKLKRLQVKQMDAFISRVSGLFGGLI